MSPTKPRPIARTVEEGISTWTRLDEADAEGAEEVVEDMGVREFRVF